MFENVRGCACVDVSDTVEFARVKRSEETP